MAEGTKDLLSKAIKGGTDARGLRGALVVGRWYPLIAERLVEGAFEWFEKHGGTQGSLQCVLVPGCFELPLALRKLAERNKALSADQRFHFLVALGTVIRGETSHYDYVCGESSRGISQVMEEFGLPVGFGLLTVENRGQAIERAGGKKGNKGAEAMEAAIEMANLSRKIQEGFSS